MEADRREPSTLSKRFVKRTDLVTRRIAGETIIVPVRAHAAELDSIYNLNELGSVIWGLIDGRNRVDKIMEAVCGVYAVGPEEAARDLVEFLASLEAEDLIRSSTEGEG